MVAPGWAPLVLAWAARGYRTAPTLDRGTWLAACPATYEAPTAKTSRVKRVAVLLWGESFRGTRKKGDRSRCPDRRGVVEAQSVVWSNHMDFFERLGRGGWAVDLFASTAPCDGAARTFEAAAILSSWYRNYLRVPMVVHQVPPDLEYDLMRKRLVAVGLLGKYRQAHGVAYSHVVQLRWDLGVVPDHWLDCFLDSGTLLDTASPRLSSTTDWDRAVVIPWRYAERWFCLLRTDDPWLEAADRCSSGAQSRDVEYGRANDTTCSCDPAFAGPPPFDGTLCWHRHVGWDLGLSAFVPHSLRELPPACQAQRDAIFAANFSSIIGDKVTRSGQLMDLYAEGSQKRLRRWPEAFDRMRQNRDYSVLNEHTELPTVIIHRPNDPNSRPDDRFFNGSDYLARRPHH